MKSIHAAPDQQEGKLAQTVEISTLCAFYGSLLTQRQRTALLLHHGEDWSLAEVADHLGVSRQNVHDLITRSCQKLRRYESALGGVAQARRIGGELRAVARELETVQSLETGAASLHIRKALDQIQEIIEDIEGEE